MKILIDLTALADNFSGIERYAACLSRELINISKDEFILLFKEEIHPMFVDYQNNDRVKMVIIPRCNKMIFNQVRLPYEIYKCKADRYLFLAFPVPVLLFKKNMFSTIHDICCWDCPETMNGLSKWYFRISHWIALRKCKRIITISEFSKKRIVEKLNYDSKKIWLIYCGVDGKFQNYHASEHDSEVVKKKYNLPENYLLSLSTLEPRKNLTLLIEAYRKLVAEQKIDIPLVLAGRKGWKIDHLLDGVEELVKKQILFTGFVDDEDLPVLYGGAELFIFPSLYEGFGMPPLEAMACGCKVLSSNSSSLPEVLGNVASYFENNDEENLRTKLMSQLTEEKIGSNSDYLYQVAKFNWQKEAEKLLSLLKSI